MGRKKIARTEDEFSEEIPEEEIQEEEEEITEAEPVDECRCEPSVKQNGLCPHGG